MSLFGWTQRKIFWRMWETEQFWGTIDFHSIFFPAMEVNGALKLPGYKLSSKHFICGWTIPLRHNPEIILICWFAIQETFLMNMSAAISPTLQPKTVCPLLSKVEPGQYLDGRPPGKTRLLLEEVLVRPAGGAHPAVCVGPNAPV